MNISKSIDKARYRGLFLNMLLSSENYVKVSLGWSNGLKYYVRVVSSGQLNNYLRLR